MDTEGQQYALFNNKLLILINQWYNITLDDMDINNLNSNNFRVNINKMIIVYSIMFSIYHMGPNPSKSRLILKKVVCSWDKKYRAWRTLIENNNSFNADYLSNAYNSFKLSESQINKYFTP